MDHSKSRAGRCAIYTRKSSEEGLEQDFIYGPLPSARPFWKILHGDDPVAFIYSASDMGKGSCPGPDGNPRTFSSINSAASSGA
jgi:hypothetical protein